MSPHRFRLASIFALIASLLISGTILASAALNDPPSKYRAPCTANTDACRQQRIVELEKHYREHAHPAPKPTVTTATPTPSASPTSSRAPVGDLAGWTQTGVENFDGTTRPAAWQPYSNTLCCDDQYDDTRNVAYNGSEMVITVRKHDADTMQGTAGQFFTDSDKGMRTAIRFKIDAPFSGSGFANIIWPSNDVWGEGEIDYPEVQFNSTIKGYVHKLSPANPAENDTVIDTGVLPTSYHEAVTEWLPGKYIRFYLDGVMIAENTTSVPTTMHSWRWQAGTNGDPVSDGGIVRIDWVAQWKPAGG